MKIRFRLAWLVVGIALTVSRLLAQDVTVTDPAWFDPENPPADQLPRFKKRPKMGIPAELKKSEQVAYVIVEHVIDEKGENLSQIPLSTNPYLENEQKGGVKFAPATQAGKAVTVTCWFGVIFNPRSASIKNDEAVPRILAVTPIVIGGIDFQLDNNKSLVIWGTVSLDEKGALRKFVFDEPTYELFRKQVDGALYHWQFAPARKGGLPVAAELHIPLILTHPLELKIDDVLPKAIYREQPRYPIPMLQSGLRGEVLLEFVIDEKGQVINPIVVQSNNPGFNEAAMKALMGWRFSPGYKGGRPVNARMQQAFVFDFEGRGAHDLMTIPKQTDKQKQKLPAEYQYDVAPKQKDVRDPIYPYALLRDSIQGSATVASIVDEQGNVFELLVKEASRPEFGLALAAAVETYEFIPALKEGKPTLAGLRYKWMFDKDTFENIFYGKEREMLVLERKHPEQILTGKKLGGPLKPISQKAPVFPCSLKGRLSSGEAEVEFLIDEKGYVRLPRIRSATEQAFGYAAVQAIAEWRFEPPTTLDGKSAVARAVVPFEFKN